VFWSSSRTPLPFLGQTKRSPPTRRQTVFRLFDYILTVFVAGALTAAVLVWLASETDQPRSPHHPVGTQPLSR
jgi:hypothetical protein